MRIAALLVGALMALQAQAHVCDGISATGPQTLAEAPAAWEALPCVPSWVDSNGTGKGYDLRLSAGGAVAWIWCPSATQGWELRFGAGTWADLTDAATELPTALLAADKRIALQSLGQAYLWRSLADAEIKPLWCPHWEAMKASKPVSWVVAPAAANASPPGTRPAFPWTNGARGTTSNGRATQGAPCNPSVGRVEGSTAYYGVNGRGDQVAVCVRAP